MSRRNATQVLPSLYTVSISRRQRIEALVARMIEHVEAKTPINLSQPPHNETTEALHRLVFQRAVKGELQVEYIDGTRGKPFPVGVLYAPQEGWAFKPKWQRHLHIGTLSLRHVDYDPYVDVYLIRDKETRLWSQAKVEAMAYQRMAELLAAPLVREEFYISVFQAGLEPLAVGLYRALTEHLGGRREGECGPFRLRPVFGFHEDGSPDTGAVWGRGWD